MSSASSSNPFSGVEPPTKRRKSSVSPRLDEVFINHRGPDVKQTLARYLHDSFRKNGIKAFLDNELELGDSFPAAIEYAIKSATVQIAIFSKGYAKSPWCLAELALMLKTKAKIIPIFYDVQPWELHRIEKGVYRDAFTEYQEKGWYKDKLEDWKEALQSASVISGYEFSVNNHDKDKLYKSIEPVVRKELERRKPLYVAKNPVGLDEIVDDFERYCQEKREKGKEKINVVGIYGMEGCGKTTLATELFNRKRRDGDYHGSCFLYDVAENGLPKSQAKLLKDLVPHLDPATRFENTNDGKSSLELEIPKLSDFRFLIVADNIDRTDQLDALLVRDALNSDSLVIVTTRDEGVLIRSGIAIRYKLKKMNEKNSIDLFCWNAFGQKDPIDRYNNLVQGFLRVCDGLPLSLRLLGRDVCTRDKEHWQLVLDDAGRGPHEDVERIINARFDALRSQEQQIFMDTACFFIGQPKIMATRIWEASASEWSADLALDCLIKKCVVEEFDEDNLALRMHRHHRDLGRKRAKNLFPPVRLWHPEDLESLDLKGFKDFISKAKDHNYRLLNTLDLSTRSQITYFLWISNDSIVTSTALIWLQLDLNGQEHRIIPEEIPLQNVKCLTIVKGRLIRLWKNDPQTPLKLKELVLHEAELVECTKSLEKLNYLEKLVLRGRNNDDGKRISAPSLSTSLRKLRDLKSLVLRHVGLYGLVDFDNSTLQSPMKSLQKIHISEEKHVRKVSISGDHCPRIRSLHIESMENLDNINLSLVETLECLELRFCTNLKVISGISDLLKLETLNIRECPELEMELSVAGLNCLERISIDGCKQLQDITGIEQLQRLQRLHLSALGRGRIKICIDRLERLPSEFTSVIGRAAQGANSRLTGELFSGLIGADGDNIRIKENGMPEVSLETMPHSLSAIIVCAAVQSKHIEKIQIPLAPPDLIDSYIAEGEWIITFVVTAKYDWISTVSFGVEIKKGCIAIVSKGDEGKTLCILKRIVGQLHEP